MTTRETLAARTFTMLDQQWFADQSRDWNPLHVDPVAARRTVSGEVVVHGMHVLLWVLDCHLRVAGTRDGLASVAATFRKPVLLKKNVSIERTREADGHWWLQVSQSAEVLTTIRLATGPISALALDAAPSMACVRRVPRELAFAELKNASGNLAAEANGAAVQEKFPDVTTVLGVARVAGVMALSRLVGMEMPGAHSLFSGVDLKIVQRSHPRISWSVTRHTVPQAPLVVAVDGSGLSGTVTAFLRPPPILQAPMGQVINLVADQRFAGQDALIVGGSRGLGEVAAKIVAAGGGRVRITYHHGEGDAARVAAQIRNAGRNCEIHRFNVEECAPATLAQLLIPAPTHIYYFASPRIMQSPGDMFDAVKAQRYTRVYVDMFAQLCRVAAAAADVRVLYPSSVFLDERPRGFAEYIAAKTAGEAVCAELDRELPLLKVMSVRLPRLKTDQTASFIGKAVAQPLPVMLKIATQFHGMKKGEHYFE